MSAIGLVLNVLTLVISTAVVILFRIIDRDNRSLDKLKRYAANLQDEIDGMVDKSIQELKNTALDLEVNARAGRELLDDVSREDSRLTEIQNRIDGLENSVKNSETAMDQLSRLTQSVEENMRNLRRESDFVTAVAKKVKEVDDRTQAIQTEMDEALDNFEAKASVSLERISDEIRSEFEAEKQDCLRVIEDAKEAAESDWSAYVDREKESFDRAADDVKAFLQTLTEEGERISDEMAAKMTKFGESESAAFESACGEIFERRREEAQLLADRIENRLEQLSTQTENIGTVQAESLQEIQNEKEKLAEVFEILKRKSGELIDQTVRKMEDDFGKTTESFASECDSILTRRREDLRTVGDLIDERLNALSDQTEQVKAVQMESFNEIQNEKERLAQVFELLKQRSAELSEQTEEDLAAECAKILNQRRDDLKSVDIVIEERLNRLREHTEKMKIAQNESLKSIQIEKERLEDTFELLKRQSSELAAQTVERMERDAEKTADVFESECGGILRRRQEEMKAAGDALEEQLGRLSEQAEDINSAQNVSLREIQEERERLSKIFESLEIRSDDLVQRTSERLEEEVRRAESVFQSECESLQHGNREAAEEIKSSFEEALASVVQQLESVKGTHEAALNRLNVEKTQILEIAERRREEAEEWFNRERESFDRAAEEIRSFVKTLSGEGERIADELVVKMNEQGEKAALAFDDQCGVIVNRRRDEVEAVRVSLEDRLQALTEEAENVRKAQNETLFDIQNEKERMESVFESLRQRSSELAEQTSNQMETESKRIAEVFKAECDDLQEKNREQADAVKTSFEEILTNVSAQLESVKTGHEAALNRLNAEKAQMLALAAQQREKAEEQIKKEIAAVLTRVKEKTDTYTAIFDAKISEIKSRMEKDLSILQEKQKRDQSACVLKMESVGADIEKSLEKFKLQSDEIETRYQRNIQTAAERALKLEDEIFEQLKQRIEERAGKSEKQMEAHLTSMFSNIETTNEEILRHFGEMRSDVEVKKEESRKELEVLKTSISAALHEADAFNRSSLTKILEEAETSRQRLKDDLSSFTSQMNADMEAFKTRMTESLTQAEIRLTENTQKLNHISSEIDASGMQMIETASSRVKQSMNELTDDVDRKISEMNRLFEEHKTHFEYKISQIDVVEEEVSRYLEEVSASIEKAGRKNDELLEQFAAESQEKRESERARTEEDYQRIHEVIESIEKEIEAVKTAAYENTSKQMSVYEDRFFADLRERIDSLNLKVLEWQQQTERDMEKILQESRAYQSEAEEQRRTAIAEGLKKLEEQTEKELTHLSGRIHSLREKIDSDTLHNEKEIEEFKILIGKNIEDIRNEAQNTFEVEFSKYDISIASRLNEYRKNLDEQIETVKGSLEENISDLFKRNETAYSDLKVMHSNVIQQMKNTESDLKAKYADLKTSVSENVNIIKDSFATQKEGIIEKAKREADDLAKAVLLVGQDVERLTADLRQKSDDTLIELNKKYDEFYAEFNYKTDTLLNELDYKTRDFRQSSADTREKIEAVQQKLHNDVEEGRKNLAFRLDEITKRIRDFESQTKLFERADLLKKKLTEDIASLRNEIDQLVIKKKEFKDIDMTLVKAKAIENDIAVKLSEMQTNKRTVDDLEKDFKRLRDTSAEINSRIDKVTASNDVVMEMQARLRQLDELERTVEDQYARLEKKEHVLNHTTMGIDKNFEEMQELETRLKNFEAVFNDFLGKLAGASKRIEALNSNKERADFAVEKLMELDSMLGDIDAKIESVTKARKWLADTESRLVQLNDSAVKNLTTLKEVTELSNLSNGKGKVDQNVLILRLAQQGWSAADIAKKLNVGLGEVQLIIEMNLNK